MESDLIRVRGHAHQRYTKLYHGCMACVAYGGVGVWVIGINCYVILDDPFLPILDYH